MGGITDKLFGNNVPDEVKSPRLMNIGTAGLGAIYTNPWTLNTFRGNEMTSNLQNLSAAMNRQAGSLEDLRGLVRPGFGRLTDAANRLSESSIRALEDSRHRSLGTLRQNLARRKVAGSSFASDDISRMNREFDKSRYEIEARNEAITAENIIKEMAMTQDLINQQAQAEANTVMQTINQGNFESSLAANMASGAQNIYQANAGIMAQMSNSGVDRLLNVGGTAIGGYLGLRNPFAQQPAAQPPTAGTVV